MPTISIHTVPEWLCLGLRHQTVSVQTSPLPSQHAMANAQCQMLNASCPMSHAQIKMLYCPICFVQNWNGVPKWPFVGLLTHTHLPTWFLFFLSLLHFLCLSPLPATTTCGELHRLRNGSRSCWTMDGAHKVAKPNTQTKPRSENQHVNGRQMEGKWKAVECRWKANGMQWNARKWFWWWTTTVLLSQGHWLTAKKAKTKTSVAPYKSTRRKFAIQSIHFICLLLCCSEEISKNNKTRPPKQLSLSL